MHGCLFRNKALARELESLLWKVSWNDITRPVSANSILGGNICESMMQGNLRLNSESDSPFGDLKSFNLPSPIVTSKKSFRRKRKSSSNSKKNEKVFDNEVITQMHWPLLHLPYILLRHQREKI